MSMGRDEFLRSIWVPYPALEVSVHPLSQILLQFEGWTAGRLVQVEEQTKEITIRDQSLLQVLSLESLTGLSVLRGRSQSRSCLEQPLVSILRPGDIVLCYVKGLLVKEVALLSPSYCDTPQVNCNFSTSVHWAHFLDSVRREFCALGLVEVTTPTLVKAYGVEPHLQGFETQLFPQREVVYLPTSPELSLKKLLCAGWDHFFEIKSVFRNGEHSPYHQPEFHMLEWYRAYRDLETLFCDLQRLLTSLVPSLRKSELEIQRTTVRALFKEFLSFDLRSDSSKEELESLSQENEIYTAESDSWEDLFHRILIEKIEPHLGQRQPLWVQDYPPSLAALSRINDEGWSDRAELYWRGIELANGYNELNDPDEYERRLRINQQVRRESELPPLPEDPSFLSALRSGCPPAAGMALGLDRLFMVLTGKSNIKEIKPLTWIY